MRRLGFVLAVWAGTAVASAGRASPDGEGEKRYSIWQSNKQSWFVASASDVGIVYVRPHVTVGWGAPFWQFVGVDAYGIATNSFSGGYAGWRASLPWLDVQWGWRIIYPYARRWLPKKDAYVPADLELGEGDERSVYSVVELEVTPLAPVLGGVIFAELHPMWFDAPRDRNLYEEVARAVVVPPFAMRTRLGYVYGVDEAGKIKTGAMLEHIVTPGRPANVTRFGPVLIVSLAERLEGLATATVPVASPDELGLYEGSYGFVGLRLRWARRF
jgi:hypothetical protein